MGSEKRLLRIAVALSELCAVGALISTGDLLPSVLLVFGVVYTLFMLFENYSPRGRLLTTLAVIATVVTSVAIKRSHAFQYLDTAAQTVLLLHLTIFFLPDPRRASYFRFGNTFVMASLAAGLSPEFRTGLMIMLYFTVAFATLSVQFIFDFASVNMQELRRAGLAKSIVALMTGVVLFGLMTAIVFPMIPRLSVGRIIQQKALGTLGFSGEVDLQSRGDSKSQEAVVALRIEIPKQYTLRNYLLSQNFLKAQSLDVFDGRSWFPSTVRGYEVEGLDSGTIDPATTIFMIREPLDSPVLPIFYGSQVRSVEMGGSPVHEVKKNAGHSYMVPLSSRRRLSVRVALGAEQEVVSDSPMHPDSMLPDRQTEMMAFIQKYSKKILDGKNSVPAQLAAIDQFFKRRHFRYTLEHMADGPQSATSRLRDFMEKDLAGHCELFATVSALILRAKGTPARLASGFRIPESHGDHYIVVRNSDAHVWVEAWNAKENRWIVFDPTPSIEVPVWQTVYKDALSLRDDLETLWYRYVVDAEEIQYRQLISGLIASSLERTWFKVILFALACVAGAYLWSKRKEHLRREYGILPERRLRSLYKKLRDRDPRSQATVYSLALYRELRFGPPLTAEQKLAKFTQAEEKIKQANATEWVF